MEVLTTIESVLVEAQHNSGKIHADDVQKKLMDYVTLMMQNRDGELSSYDISIIGKIKIGLENSPFTKQDLDEWKFVEVKPADFKYAIAQIDEGLKNVPENAAPTDLYDYKAPENCMREAMADFKSQLELFHQIYESHYNPRNSQGNLDMIQQVLMGKFEIAIRQLYERVEKDKCYENSYYLTTIAIRFKRFIDEPYEYSSFVKMVNRWSSYFISTQNHQTFNVSFLVRTYQNVVSEIGRTSTSMCYFNRLLIIRRSLENLYVELKKCRRSDKCMEGKIGLLRALWTSERDFVSTFNCADRRYVYIIQFGEWILDFSERRRISVISTFSERELADDKPLLREHYQKLIEIMSSRDASLRQNYINNCTLPIAMDLLAYLEHPGKRSALKLCMKNKQDGSQLFYDFMTKHYRDFMAWIEYRTIACRFGMFHLIVNQFSVNLRIASYLMIKNFENLENTIHSSGRRNKKKN